MRDMVSMSRVCWPIAWNALRGLMVAGKAGAIVRERGFQYLSVRPKDIFQSIQSLLQFSSIAGSQTRLLTFFVLADGPIATAPATGRLATITFDLDKSDEIYE